MDSGSIMLHSAATSEQTGAGESASIMAANANVSAVAPAAAVEASSTAHQVARQSTSASSALAIPKATAKHPTELSSSSAPSINPAPMPSLTDVRADDSIAQIAEDDRRNLLEEDFPNCHDGEEIVDEDGDARGIVPALPGGNSANNEVDIDIATSINGENTSNANSMGVGVPENDARGEVAAATTARQTTAKSTKKKAPKQPPIRKGGWVFATRKIVAHNVDVASEAYKVCLHFKNDKYRFYGTCLGGAGKKLYKVRFDDLPVGENEIELSRKDIQTIAKGTIEIKYDPREKAAEDEIEACATTQKKTPNFADESEKAFKALPTATQATAKTFVLKYGSGDDEKIDWTILADSEQIT